MANDFLPFGVAGGANVIDQATFAALPARLQGFVAGVALSQQLNKVWRQSSSMAAAIGELITDFGGLDALDNGDIDALEANLVRTLMRAPWSVVTATGTANAWVVSPSPTLTAYALGRPQTIVAPATNTSTTVNANFSGLGNRRIKKADGTDPAIGDLVGGRAYSTYDDGTNIRVLTPLASDTVSRLSAQYFTASGTLTIPANATQMLLRAWGGAAGGGGISASGGGGGGGGGGEYREGVFAVTPGATYAVTVGSGGAGGSSAGGNGGSGTSTSVGALITAAGGSPGLGGNNTYGAGGLGGTGGSGGSFSQSGGNGSNAGYLSPNVSSGTGGGSWNVSNHYIQFTAGAGGNGLFYGQGGNGATGGSGAAVGGAGGGGLVIAEFA